MKSYEERAKKFIQQVFPYIEDCEDEYDTKECIYHFNVDFNRNVKVANGLSRIALITSDYVVKWDYDMDEINRIGGCEDEIYLYAEAEKDGFDYLFAKITRYEYNDRKFYIMPRIRGINGRSWNYARDYMTEEEKKWCNKYNLTDLHSNNYGFRSGHVCIIDYACQVD